MGYQTKFLMPYNAPSWLKKLVEIYVDNKAIEFHDPVKEIIEAPIFIIPSMMHTGHNFHPAFNSVAQYAVRAAWEGGLPEGKPSRLYLSRTRAKTAWHSITNEAEVEGVFLDHGFQIVHPQEMSLIPTPTAQYR